MVTKTIKARFKNGMIEPLETIDIPDGKEILISIVEEQSEDAEKHFKDAIRSTAGAWKDTIDCDELIKNIYNDRMIK